MKMELMMIGNNWRKQIIITCNNRSIKQGLKVLINHNVYSKSLRIKTIQVDNNKQIKHATICVQ